MQLTLRELQREIRDVRIWIGLVAAGVVFGIAGPFGTETYLTLPARLVYWTFLAGLTFFSGSFAVMSVMNTRIAQSRPRWVVVIIGGLAAGFLVLVELLAVNWVVFGVHPTEAGYLFALGVNVIAIAGVITVASYLLETQTTQKLDDRMPRLLDRLSYDLRGTLVSMTVQDHYVEVTTSAGAELVLIRFSDAIAETDPVDGLQVHRSHWVNIAQVKSVQRQGGKTALIMSNGQVIPVSRTYLGQIKDRGLIPN